ncbi:hypothetical protein VE01_08652 [Pseudogymnoascus verrucosus]|uniref:Zn(2)-C6 fungal-type domain-containing protein n=1 Tax=Pseudogymnoascus verrucosus TaxID=342668 RepID=A0A1B8GC80_9PEZI|nr:uncharacterized protein VE01_08652 [Pseudogymnoascus verrucosus]OBT93455.1 hypothetical protein VE01_08652 [Pseudogymnoascus verrucosus]
MDADDHGSLESEAKRRRLRKGTHSCWACKRRKVRCTFASSTEATCIICRRRGTKCISQGLPEDLSQIEDTSSRIVRVEALLNQLVKEVDHSSAAKEQYGAQSRSKDRGGPQSAGSTPAVSTPGSRSEQTTFIPLHHGPTQERFQRGSENGDTSAYHLTPEFHTPYTLSPAKVVPPNAGKYEKFSRALLAGFPSQEDLDILVKAGSGITVFCHQVNVKLRSQLVREGLQDETKIIEVQNLQTHPVLLAKQMLMFSSMLLHLPPNENIPGLSEHHRVIMERLADTAISEVTTCEELLGTMESLECIVLEAFYHLNCGNMRRSLLAFRRAVVAGQFMGMNRPNNLPVEFLDPSTNIDPQVIWFRIVYMDRFLSLMLGLPQGHSDTSISSETALERGEPSERLERLHTMIFSRMLEHNNLGLSQSAIEMTHEINADLLKAAEGMPARFWGPPNFAGLEKDSQEALWESMRVKDQIFHYTMLNQLHLPFLLSSGAERKNEYAKITCVNSSREILTQFVAFRAFNRISASCRLADFLALIAGMTLIIAHLYSHREKETDNLLAHQRLGDRATMEQALESMEESSNINEDKLAASCARLLQHLLHIEADAAQGHNYSVKKAQLSDGGHGDGPNVLLITVPYFGTIRFTRDGIRVVEVAKVSARHMQEHREHVTIGGIGSVQVANQIPTNDYGRLSGNSREYLVDYVDSGSLSSPSQERVAQPPAGELYTDLDAAQANSVIIGDDFMQEQELYPGVAAGQADWVFQGFDTTFFDNLMGGESLQFGDGGLSSN